MDNRDELKVSGLKLSELRPCDDCGGKLTPMFKHIQVRQAVFNAKNSNSVLGLVQMWGGKGLKIAEAMAPGADNAVEIIDQPTDLFICEGCYLGHPLDLPALLEKRVQPSESRDGVDG